MNLTLTIFRWIVAIPAALLGSDFCGMLLGFITWGIRHLGGKIFGDAIDSLQKLLTMIDNFIIGVLFVLIGVLIVPVHSLFVIIGFAGVKAWVDYHRSPGTFQSASSTWGAISSAVVLSYVHLNRNG
jgi:hypothetical protein